MLLQLEISNIALIEHIIIDFEDGLNVLSGETGAGKSIIIDSINAVLGGRITRDLIRTGCDFASVTALYEFSSDNINSLLEQNGITPEEDGMIIISREFTSGGRNICRINRKTVPLSFLKQVGELLIDIHGQHDNQSLLNVGKHIELLDSFGGKELENLKKDYFSCLEEYRKLKSEFNRINRDAQERERRIEFLQYQINEIGQAKLKLGEEEELLSRKQILSSAERISAGLNEAYQDLYEGTEKSPNAYDLISKAGAELAGISKISERYHSLSEKIDEINYQLYDIIEEIRKESENLEFEPGEIEEIEDRLDTINNLKRKYGKNIEIILKYASDADEEYKRLIDFDGSVKGLTDNMLVKESEIRSLAQKISELRKVSAHTVEEGITSHFADLEMKKVKFKIDIRESESFLDNGKDLVEFLVSANPGEPFKPLAKIASGGEMSRIMLAIKAMLAKADNIPTMIFDEIDTGISGVAAFKVAEKMRLLSEDHQILCVTHIASIAVAANNNLLIEKEYGEDFARTTVKQIKGEALVNEIARLLDGGAASEASKFHAREMLQVKNKV